MMRRARRRTVIGDRPAWIATCAEAVLLISPALPRPVRVMPHRPAASTNHNSSLLSASVITFAAQPESNRASSSSAADATDSRPAGYPFQKLAYGSIRRVLVHALSVRASWLRTPHSRSTPARVLA